MPGLMLGSMPAVGFGTWPLKGNDCMRLVGERFEHQFTGKIRGHDPADDDLALPSEPSRDERST